MNKEKGAVLAYTAPDVTTFLRGGAFFGRLHHS